MNKRLFRDCLVLFFAASLFCFSSCKDDDNDSKKEDQAQASGDNQKAASSQPAAPIVAMVNIKLDTLYVDRTTFENVPNGKLVFSFTFTPQDQLTMHGWHATNPAGTKFNKAPSIRLVNGKASTITAGPGIYFNNIVLQQSQRVAIEKILKAKNANYVVFAPMLVDQYSIGYNVFVSSTPPTMAMGIMALDPTGEDANPSPPKSYN